MFIVKKVKSIKNISALPQFFRPLHLFHSERRFPARTYYIPIFYFYVVPKGGVFVFGFKNHPKYNISKIHKTTLSHAILRFFTLYFWSARQK
jgi:hypothetical protein